VAVRAISGGLIIGKLIRHYGGGGKSLRRNALAVALALLCDEVDDHY
jgi:hypothetical protein